MKKLFCLFALLVLIWFGLYGIASPAWAQAISNTKISLMSPKDQSDIPDTMVITEDEGEVNGSTFIYKPEMFSILADQVVRFDLGSEINKIIVQVAGSSSSVIDGLIKADQEADVFLINPCSISFKPSARLQIGGSFVASTASEFRLEDESLVLSLGTKDFNPPASITVSDLVVGEQRDLLGRLENPQDGLQVSPDKTLALLGGRIDSNGGVLSASGGRIELGSVGSTGEVRVTPDGTKLTLSYMVGSYSDINLANQTGIDVSSDISVPEQRAGDVQINGKVVSIVGGSQIEANTEGLESGGSLSIKATDKVMIVGPNSGLFAQVYPEATGDGGSLTIDTHSLSLEDGSITTATFGMGVGGDLTITASELVNIEGKGRLLTTLSDRLVGNEVNTHNTMRHAGDLSIETNKLLVSGSEALVSTSTFGTGNAGNLTIQGADTVEINEGLITTEVGIKDAIGNAGPLTMDIGHLKIVGGGQIQTGTRGKGLGGELTVQATEAVEVIGRTPDFGFPSAIGSQVAPDALGDGGNVTIETGRLVIQDGAEIDSSTRGNGSAGDVTITAESVEVTGRSVEGEAVSQITAAVESGAVGEGGVVSINSGTLTVSNGGIIISSY